MIRNLVTVWTKVKKGVKVEGFWGEMEGYVKSIGFRAVFLCLVN